MLHKRSTIRAALTRAAVATVATLAVTTAQAVDGCKFLLCIAGPWASIAECRPTVYEVFRDLAEGKPFPTCGMSGGGNTAYNIWLDEYSCPSMYRNYNPESGSFIGCTYPARIAVVINDQLWSQVYWNMGGETSTWFSDVARESLTSASGSMPIDDRYATDLATWNKAQVSHCIAGGGTVLYDPFGAFERCNLPNPHDGA